MIQIAIIKPEDVEAHWDELLPFVQMAIEESNGELTADGVFESLMKNELIIAPVFNDGKLIAAVTFDLVTFSSGKKVLSIQLAGGGGLDLWMDQIEGIAVELAKMHNCSQVYVVGRVGWGKKLKGLGYSTVHTIFAKGVE